MIHPLRPPPNPLDFGEVSRLARCSLQEVTVGAEIKTGLLLSNPVRWQNNDSYEIKVTLAACKPFGPSSMENSTFCSGSSLR